MTPWTATFQAPLNMGYYRQEYWSGLPCPPLGDLPNPGIEPTSLMSPASTSRFFTTSTSWEAHICLWASFVAQQETPGRFLGRKIPWRRDRLPTPVFLGFPGDSDVKESTCNAGDMGSILGLGRSPRGGHGNPLQYSCLENPIDSQTQLSN